LQLKNMGLRVGDTSYVHDFAKNTVQEQRHNGSPIAPGTKIQQGSVIDLVLSDGVGEAEFAVPNLIGMTFGDAKNFIESNGLSFLSVMPDTDVTDTASAFICEQHPPRMGADGKRCRDEVHHFDHKTSRRLQHVGHEVLRLQYHEYTVS